MVQIDFLESVVHPKLHKYQKPLFLVVFLQKAPFLLSYLMVHDEYKLHLSRLLSHLDVTKLYLAQNVMVGEHAQVS